MEPLGQARWSMLCACSPMGPQQQPSSIGTVLPPPTTAQGLPAQLTHWLPRSS